MRILQNDLIKRSTRHKNITHQFGHKPTSCLTRGQGLLRTPNMSIPLGINNLWAYYHWRWNRPRLLTYSRLYIYK